MALLIKSSERGFERRICSVDDDKKRDVQVSQLAGLVSLPSAGMTH